MERMDRLLESPAAGESGVMIIVWIAVAFIAGLVVCAVLCELRDRIEARRRMEWARATIEQQKWTRFWREVMLEMDGTATAPTPQPPPHGEGE